MKRVLSIAAMLAAVGVASAQTITTPADAFNAAVAWDSAPTGVVEAGPAAVALQPAMRVPDAVVMPEGPLDARYRLEPQGRRPRWTPSAVFHDGAGVFAGLPSPLTATRYHSLALDPATVPDVLEVSARTESGVIMAVRHRSLPVESVQFHPESVLTEGGYQMLANWLAVCGDPDAPARAVGLTPLMAVR